MTTAINKHSQPMTNNPQNQTSPKAVTADAGQLKRTKIIATLGPATSSPERVRQLVKSGVNVFRLNMSHGNGQDQMDWVKMIRDASQELGQPIGILADLQGPKIR